MVSKFPADPNSPHPEKPRRGRPRKALAEKRRHTFTVSFNDDELGQFNACRGEREAADYLRLIATRRTPLPPLVPAINRTEYVRLYQLERELAALGERVRPDELTHPTELARHLWKLLSQTRSEVVALRRTLIGVGP